LRASFFSMAASLAHKRHVGSLFFPGVPLVPAALYRGAVEFELCAKVGDGLTG
jgi:hypothetical protein